MYRFLSPLVCAGAVLAALGSPASAGDLEIEVETEVPFSAEELESAVALRTNERPPRIHVASAQAGEVVIVTVGTARRTVALSGLRGPAAARRVALVSLDLFRELLQPVAAVTEAPPPAAVEDIEVPAARARTPRDSVVVVAKPRLRVPRAVLTVSARLGESGRGGAAHASIGLRGPWRGFLGAALEIGDGADDLRFTQVPLGAGVGLRYQKSSGVRARAVEVFGAVVLAPHRIAIDDGSDRLGHTKMRLGSGIVASISMRAVGPMWVSLTSHVNAYFTRQRYVVGGDEVFTTSRTEMSVGLGLSWAKGAMP